MKNSESVKEYYIRRSSTWKKYRKKRKYYWDSITNYVNYFIDQDCSILEVGCGSGEMIAALSGNKKVGIDFCQPLIDEAKSSFQNVEFYCMEAENITLTEKFDVILLSNIVGTLEDIQKVFLQLQKVSHPHTKIIITYYNHLWEPIIKLAEWLSLKRELPQQNWLSSIDISNLLYLANFETYKSNRSMIMPYKIPLISNFLNRFVSKLPFINTLSLNKFVFARPMPIEESEAILNNKFSTSVVIPARNESGNIEQAILRMPKFGKSVEIIFVEGNSTDDTWDTILKVQEKYKDTHDIKVARQDGKGKGDAVRKGYAMATGDILMILDADLTVPPEDLPKFYNALASGKGEFINGVRLVYPMEKKAMRPLNLIGNHFFSRMFSWILEAPIKDTLCGTKVMFRTDYIKLANNRTFFGEFDPFGDYDLLFGAYKLNLKIIDLPIRYKDRSYGDTNISRFKHGMVLLRMTIFASMKIKFL